MSSSRWSVVKIYNKMVDIVQVSDDNGVLKLRTDDRNRKLQYLTRKKTEIK